ncbi:MAG: flagellar biosynthesis anti-sigma factor FlgM [Bdellovibrionales bacterium]|nr:flagellar biosynthesis anti-sigma factor FlgM [Bdellovibrionales bacterium]
MSNDNENKESGRKRSLTSLTLAWLSEKLRRAEEIKEKVHSGAYQVDSEKLAASMVNKDR